MNQKIIDLKQQPNPGKFVASAVIFGFVAILLWSAFFTVPAESEGVVMRFGQFISTKTPGLHFKLPLGVDRV